jgi:hypothetical protein
MQLFYICVEQIAYIQAISFEVQKVVRDFYFLFFIYNKEAEMRKSPNHN